MTLDRSIFYDVCSVMVEVAVDVVVDSRRMMPYNQKAMMMTLL